MVAMDSIVCVRCSRRTLIAKVGVKAFVIFIHLPPSTDRFRRENITREFVKVMVYMDGERRHILNMVYLFHSGVCVCVCV